MTVILAVGDIMGRPGRDAVRQLLPSLKKEYNIDFVIANGENAAGGKGITPPIAQNLHDYGIDVITGGNHIWANREIYKVIDIDPKLLRPANFPADVGIPGNGFSVYEIGNDIKIGIVNLIGRIFMRPYDCPFRAAEKIVKELQKQTRLIAVDFHAEATSEKVALGWFLDGKVSAVIGTHTHVQTADERILPGGTAYITDCGMTGARDSIIGVKKDIIIDNFLKMMPVKHSIATEDVWLNGVVITADHITGKASAIKRLSIPVK